MSLAGLFSHVSILEIQAAQGVRERLAHTRSHHSCINSEIQAAQGVRETQTLKATKTSVILARSHKGSAPSTHTGIQEAVFSNMLSQSEHITESTPAHY